MSRVRLVLSYDGTDYCGWQKQKAHICGPKLPSIQETVEQALQKILNQSLAVSASGRTDAGVHAVYQVTHFDTTRTLPRDLCWALKSQLPASISAKYAWIAPSDFHSTLSARWKTYRYYIWNDDRPTALLARYSWWIRKKLDIELLQALTQPILGTHDFASFQSKGTPVRHTVRTIYRAEWKKINQRLLLFEVTGSGFLKQMVRNMVGTVVDGSLKGQTPQDIQRIMATCDRTQAGPTCPPQGLFLYRVGYPKKLDRLCVKI